MENTKKDLEQMEVIWLFFEEVVFRALMCDTD
jgi:hypothetical protein